MRKALKKKYKFLTILFCLQLCHFFGYTQNSTLKFTRLNTSNGLSQNSVFAIEKDFKGFMWFGTDEGLNKFDGYKFTVFKNDPEKKSTISGNSIFSIKEDNNHNLWILTQNGLDKFDRKSETFSHYLTGKPWTVSSNIFQDSKKRIWIGSGEGFCLFDTTTGNAKFYKNNPANDNSLSENYVYKITQDNNGNLWIGTRHGLNRFNPETEKFTRFVNTPGDVNSIGSGFIKTVYKDSRGNIWAGTQGSGIAKFNPQTESFTNFRHNPDNPTSVAYNDILSFTEDANGKLWVGTENGGISIYDYSSNNFTATLYNEYDPNSLSGNSIYSLYRDDVGNIWAGTWSGGINFLPFYGDKFKLYKKSPGDKNSLSNNLVLSMSSDDKNNIWIGTDGGGLNQFNTVTHSFVNYQQDAKAKNGIYNNYVLTVFPYSPDTLVMGFHRGGIDFFDQRTHTFVHYGTNDINSNRLTSLSVLAAYKDRRNNLWLSNDGYGGIFLFDPSTKKFIPFLPDSANAKSIANVSVFVMYETKAGQFWIGGDKGLDLFDRDKNEFTHHQYNPKNKNSLPDNIVNCIAEDKLGNLWVGTAGGLCYYNISTGVFTSYKEQDGLANNTIWAIQQDHNGNLWVSTNNGISRFDIATKKFRNYTTSDGLQSSTFKHKASAQTADGEIFFGGVNGFNSFYPDSIRDNNFVPPIYITGLEIFNRPVYIDSASPLKQSINDQNEIVLSYKQSVFTIEFAALNFTSPEKNQYAYMLENFDADWNYAGNKRTATYTNLNPGSYRFKVIASNNDGVWNQKATTVKIIILPPYWQTWWFRLCVLLAIIAAIVTLYKIRTNAIESQKLLLQQKVNEQTTELIRLNADERKARLQAEQSRLESELAREQANKANNSLQTKNKELEQFAYVASHDLQEPLRTTLGFVDLLQRQYAGKLDAKADKYLNFIADSSKRMKVLITDLLDFSRIGAKAAMEKVDCNVVVKNVLNDIMAAVTDANAVVEYEQLPVIDGYSTEIKLLFQNLLINAVKFRKKDVVPMIKITAEHKSGAWQFAVKDNGIGIEKQYSERIFDIFQRLNNRSEYEGSGIGLSHCKKIVELHQGNIWMESVPGEGCTFLFTIPDKKLVDEK